MDTAQSCEAVKKITKPLLKNLPVNTFVYARFYPNGKRLSLSNSEAFLDHHVDKDTYMDGAEKRNYFKSVPTPQIAENLNSMIRIADVNALIMTTNSAMKDFYLQMLEDTSRFLNLQAAYSILIAKPNYYEEFIFFADNKHRRAYETFMSNHDVLQHFRFYFLEKAYHLIRQTKILDETPFDNETVFQNNKDALEAMKTQKFFIDTDASIYLTKREAHCAHLITRNFNAREISEQMKISQRTVEEYIQNIKLKSQILNKSKLQSYLCQLGFDNLVEFSPRK